MRALGGVGQSLAQVFTHAAISITTNIITFCLSLPVLVLVAAAGVLTRSWGVVPFAAALVLGVLPNPASAGLQIVASELARGDDTTLQDIWRGLRVHGLFALKCWPLSLAGTLLIVGNMAVYGSIRSPVGIAASALWATALLVWLAMHLYLYPLIFAQEEQRVVATYRNAFAVVASRPGATFTVLPLWLGLLVLGATTGLVTFIALMLAAVIQHTTFQRLLPTLPRTS